MDESLGVAAHVACMCQQRLQPGFHSISARVGTGRFRAVGQTGFNLYNPHCVRRREHRERVLRRRLVLGLSLPGVTGDWLHGGHGPYWLS
jgi:hypothetical protein